MDLVYTRRSLPVKLKHVDKQILLLETQFIKAKEMYI